MQIFGKVNQANYSIALDGTQTSPHSTAADLANNILADFQDLADTNHTIVLTTSMPAVSIDQLQPAFFFDKVLITSHDLNANVTQQALNDSNIAYSGQWTFLNVSGSPFHHSNTSGDHAQAQFQGISLLLNGTTSPTSSRYTIILDHVATTLSAKSSFLNRESLLFYASSLDPNVTHTLEVVNEDGGDLSLNFGGFSVFSAAGSAISATPSTSMSLTTYAPSRKGTIAALVLGGLLFFIILSGLLFVVFVFKPRRRRRRRLGLGQNRKTAEAGIVINIGPEQGPDAEVESRRTEISPPQRISERSGFARWKREVEGGLGTLIGISFRHSDSSRGRAANRRTRDNDILSLKPSLFTSSSKASSKKSKGKGKKKSKRRHVSEGSWSPSVAIELPVRPLSADSGQDKDIDPSQDIPEGPPSVVSTLTSLSYISSPRNTHPAPPPSYSASNSNRNSHSTSGPHSVPHSISHSSASATHHSRMESQGFLEGHGGPNPGSSNDEPPHGRYVLLSQVPDTHNPPSRAPSEDHHDSPKNSPDDTASFLAAFTQLALRGLSPRTSEFQPNPGEPQPAGTPLNVDHHVKARPLPQPPESPAEQFGNYRVRDSLMDGLPPESSEEMSGETAPRSFDDSYLNVVSSSPFRVDFPPPRSFRQNRDSGPAVSFVRFDEESKEELTTSGGEQGSTKQAVEDARDPMTKRRSLFRLTPPSGGPSKIPSSRQLRADSMSFLDFSSSSGSSTRTPSLKASDEQEGTRQWGQLPHRLQSRWSNTATELSRHGSVGPPRSVFSGNFPYPVSLPTSAHHPEGHVRPERISISTQRVSQLRRESTDGPPPTRVHPFLPISPADSVPISLSEIQFRRSSTESHSTGSPIPPHPPLPGRESGIENENPTTPPLSTPNLIVQRVLGQVPAPPSTRSSNPTHRTT